MIRRRLRFEPELIRADLDAVSLFQLREVDLFIVHKSAVGTLKILNAPTVLGTSEGRMVLGNLFVRQLDIVVNFAADSELGSFERKSQHDLSVIITHQTSIHVMSGFQGRFSFILNQGKNIMNRPTYQAGFVKQNGSEVKRKSWRIRQAIARSQPAYRLHRVRLWGLGRGYLCPTFFDNRPAGR